MELHDMGSAGLDLDTMVATVCERIPGDCIRSQYVVAAAHEVAEHLGVTPEDRVRVFKALLSPDSGWLWRHAASAGEREAEFLASHPEPALAEFLSLPARVVHGSQAPAVVAA